MMGATNNKRDRARAGFTPPTQDEVEAFIKTAKQDWPAAFCEHYAMKFFMHYRSTGWKLSSGVSVKDWQAAFWSRWASPSFKEDQELLAKCLKAPAHMQYLDKLRRDSAGLFAEQEAAVAVNPIDHTLNYLDEIMHLELKGAANDAQLDALADWLRPRKLLRLTPLQTTRILELQGNDAVYGKRMAVKQFLRNLRDKQLNIKSFYYLQQQKNAQTSQ